MIASFLLLGAALFYLIAGVGLLRLPDSLARLHAGAKASSLATILALAAAFAHHGGLWTGIMCAGALLFVFLTAPLASHAIARCVLRTRLDDSVPVRKGKESPIREADEPPPQSSRHSKHSEHSERRLSMQT